MRNRPTIEEAKSFHEKRSSRRLAHYDLENGTQRPHRLTSWPDPRHITCCLAGTVTLPTYYLGQTFVSPV